MAVVRVRLGSFANEAAVIYMEYENTTMRVSAIVVENTLPESINAALIRNNDNQIYTQTFPTGNTTLAVPTQGQGRVDITDLGHGKWGNISLQMGVIG